MPILPVQLQCAMETLQSMSRLEIWRLDMLVHAAITIANNQDIYLGSNVFTGYYTVENAMEECDSVAVCAGITFQLNSESNGLYYVFGKSYGTVDNDSQWVSYVKNC